MDASGLYSWSDICGEWELVEEHDYVTIVSNELRFDMEFSEEVCYSVLED